MFVVELPWPDKSLSPNGRVHWATKARAVKDAKRTAAVMARVEIITRPQWLSARLEWAFHPKTAHALDLDNCIASCKAYQDGISIALGIDDSKFDTTYRIAEPVKGGKVVVTISPL
jgi:crossover junction endodeoxyribonuclease RusA